MCAMPWNQKWCVSVFSGFCISRVTRHYIYVYIFSKNRRMLILRGHLEIHFIRASTFVYGLYTFILILFRILNFFFFGFYLFFFLNFIFCFVLFGFVNVNCPWNTIDDTLFIIINREIVFNSNCHWIIFFFFKYFFQAFPVLWELKCWRDINWKSYELFNRHMIITGEKTNCCKKKL